MEFTKNVPKVCSLLEVFLQKIKIMFIITGIGLIYIAYLLYEEAKVRLSKDENRIKSFIDNIGSKD